MAQYIIGKTAGFRFPFVNYTAYGILALSELGYSYESSIRVDHLNDFVGAIFPYNLVIAPDGVLETVDILEISPVQEDWFFYGKIYDKPYSSKELKESQQAYYSYLTTIWSIIKDAGGVMVQMGHPMYEGHSKKLLQPVLRFIDSLITQKDVWITSLGELSGWWRRLSDVKVLVDERGKSLTFRILNPVSRIERFAVWIDVPKNTNPPRIDYDNCIGFHVERNTEQGKRIYIIINLGIGESWVRVRF